MRISDYIRIDPLWLQDGTAAATSNKIPLGNVADFSVVVQFSLGTANDEAATAAAQSATAAGAIEFSVVEATADTAAGSAISGATVTLGCATAAMTRGAVAGIIQITTNLTTASVITINGISYQTTVTGVGTNATAITQYLANAINGKATSQKLPHYTAIPNWRADGNLRLEPNDDLGTGLTIETSAAASTYVVFPGLCQGIIDIPAYKLSTNYPKYIGVVAGESTAAGVRAAMIVRKPYGGPAFPGRTITLAT